MENSIKVGGRGRHRPNFLFNLKKERNIYKLKAFDIAKKNILKQTYFVPFLAGGLQG